MAMSFFNLKWENYEISQAEWLWLIPLFIFISLIMSLVKVKVKSKQLNDSDSASLANTNNKTINIFHPLAHLSSSTSPVTKSHSSIKILYFLIFCLLVIALSQPIKVGKKLPEPPQERDIVFIVDASVSMILRDYILNGERIDRMTLLKGVLDEFIRKLKGERMSIIVFGDTAYTLVPLTSDQALLRKMLARVQATVAGRFNAMGDGIALAVKQASKPTKELSHKIKTTRKRVLVLLTDADQPTGDISPIVAAQLAKKEKLPLYTIAIGASQPGAEEKNRKGGLIYSPVDLALVKQLSEITGAKSFQAGDPNALKNAVETINQHESNKGKAKPLYYRETLYHWFLIAAFALFTLSQVISLLTHLVFINAKVKKVT